MLTKIETMDGSSRAWVYQANRELLPNEQSEILKETKSFLNTWAAHGHDLLCAADILHNRFLIIVVDESYNKASGCSIDTSVNFIKQLQSTYDGLDFFDRAKIALMKGDGGIAIINFANVESSIRSGEILLTDRIFNNSVASMQDFRNLWLQNIEESWLKRYFVKA